MFGYPKTVYRKNHHHGRGCSECRESSVPLGWGYPQIIVRGALRATQQPITVLLAWLQGRHPFDNPLQQASVLSKFLGTEV